MGLQQSRVSEERVAQQRYLCDFATFCNQECTEWKMELDELSHFSPSTLKPSPICISVLFFQGQLLLDSLRCLSQCCHHQVSKFFLLPNSYKKLFFAPLLGIAKSERSPLLLQVFLTCICSNFSPFFLVTLLIFTWLLVSPLDIPYNLCISLKAHHSKLSTAHYRTSPTVAGILLTYVSWKTHCQPSRLHQSQKDDAFTM